ncbi:MAG: 2-aminobenzoate-CoA ligase [Rhodocyclaceae bacterium]|nr:MAG: 2-aminobenzoate-CoA ligase [Rhodocyclaceae bacterium]
MTPSAHQDTFARNHLPPPKLWPELLFELPELQYPQRLNCAAEILDKAVTEKGWGERIALRGPMGTFSYRELLAQANRIARVLTEDMGLVPGNRVLLHSPNAPLMVACWLAIQKAGGIAVSTMPLLRAKELGEIIAKAQISHALYDHSLTGELELARSHQPVITRALHFQGPQGSGLEALMQGKADDFDNVDTAADDVAMIAFTSGTTGKPKGTMHFHRDVMAICDCFPRSTLKPEPDDIFCGAAPLAFTFGLGGLVLFPLRYGASSVIGVKPGPEALLQAIQDYRVTIGFSVPTGYRLALPMLPRFDIASLKKCVSAGEALPVATREAWLKATGIKLIDGIGSTEMLHIFISAAGDDIRPGAIGKPIPGYRATILDEAGNPLPPRKIGRLGVKGPTGCRYLDDSRQHDYVVNGWNVTGDTFFKDEDGYFFYQSRNDDMIITAGNNIGGPEVEDALLKHPAVSECAVVGTPDDERGQVVKAFVVLNSGHEASDELKTELQNHVKQLLAPFKYPRIIEFRHVLPRTETGKLQRFKLREEALRAQAEAEKTPTPQAAMKPHNSPHEIIQPEHWARPRGFSNGIKARGSYVSIAGQVGWDAQRRFVSSNFTAQSKQALQNVVEVVRAAGGKPEHIVRLTWYVTDKREYLAQARELGLAYLEIMGRFYPPMSVVEIAELVEDAAKVEIEATAIIPDE